MHRRLPNFTNRMLAVLASLVLFFAVAVRAQDKDADSKGKSDSASRSFG